MVIAMYIGPIVLDKDDYRYMKVKKNVILIMGIEKVEFVCEKRAEWTMEKSGDVGT